jgi:hypothetical protein
MNGFKVFAFFFIVLLALISCASTSNFPGDIEMGNTAIMRRVVQNGVQNVVENGGEENEDENEDENDFSDEVHFFPVMTLEVYRNYLAFNILVYFLVLFVTVTKHSEISNMLFSLALVLKAWIYFESLFEAPLNNVQIFLHRWLLVIFYYLIQIFLFILTDDFDVKYK